MASRRQAPAGAPSATTPGTGTARGALAWLPGVTLLAVLALGAAMSVTSDAWGRVGEEASPWDGEATAAFEAAFDEGLWIRDLGVHTWGVLQYGLFRQGRDGVRVGTRGWLFTREEFEGRPDEGRALQRDVGAIGAAHEALRARGVALLVVLVPAKAQVYPSRLGRWRLPGYVEARYETVHGALRDGGIPVVDGLDVLAAAPGGAPTFFRTDTHWTPAGAARIADAAARAAEAADVAPAEGEPYRTVEGAREPLEGDLLPFLALGPWQEALGPEPETLQRHDTRPVEPDAEGDGLFGAASVPIVLVGTSYSADARWNFAGALREAFSNDVLNLAAEGEGPRAPMRAALNGDELEDVGAELVVWEIPIRYLGADAPHP